MNGYDISDWQGDINNAVVPSEFVFIKATEGVGYTDPNCDANYQQSKAAGKKLGVYHFARPDGNSAVDEANWFVSQVQGYLGEAILALDFETAPFDPAWAKVFLDRVFELTSIRPLLYSYTSVLNTGDWSSIWPNYGLWLAQPGANLPTNGYSVPSTPPSVNGNWTIVLWQYNTKTTLSGWNGFLDVDVFYGNAATWDAYATALAPVVPTPVTPTPVEVPVVPAPVVIPVEPVVTPPIVVPPVVVPAPVEQPTPVVEVKPSKLKATVSLIRDIAGFSAVKGYLRTLFDPHTGLGRTIRGLLQSAIGIIGFMMLTVSLPSFYDFWLSMPALTSWATPATIIGVVTAVWNGLGAVISYYSDLQK